MAIHGDIMSDETIFEFGDVVDCDICTTPMSITIFGKLNGPEKYGDIYVGGNSRTIGIALKGHYLSKTGVDLKKADQYRERYIEQNPDKLK
jgi:hypothetical protein